MEDVLKHLDRAQWYANAMLEGGENLHLRLWPLEAPRLHAEIESLKRQLEDQRAMLVKRFNAMTVSVTGSELDRLYHTKLEAFIDRSQSLEATIKSIMAHEYRYLKYVRAGISACCLCLFIVAGLVFYRFERLRRDHYLKLLEMQQRMIRNEKLASLGAMITGITHEVNNPNTFAEQIGATLTVQSTVGSGSTFRLKLNA